MLSVVGVQFPFSERAEAFIILDNILLSLERHTYVSGCMWEPKLVSTDDVVVAINVLTKEPVDTNVIADFVVKGLPGWMSYGGVSVIPDIENHHFEVTIGSPDASAKDYWDSYLALYRVLRTCRLQLYDLHGLHYLAHLQAQMPQVHILIGAMCAQSLREQLTTNHQVVDELQVSLSAQYFSELISNVKQQLFDEEYDSDVQGAD